MLLNIRDDEDLRGAIKMVCATKRISMLDYVTGILRANVMSDGKNIGIDVEKILLKK
jgi:hypothetical protein